MDNTPIQRLVTSTAMYRQSERHKQFVRFTPETQYANGLFSGQRLAEPGQNMENGSVLAPT